MKEDIEKFVENLALFELDTAEDVDHAEWTSQVPRPEPEGRTVYRG
jgi:hypothetical protein